MLSWPRVTPQTAIVRRSTRRRSKPSGTTSYHRLQSVIQKRHRVCAQPASSHLRGCIPARSGRVLRRRCDPRNRSIEITDSSARRSGSSLLRLERSPTQIAGSPNLQIQCESAPAASSGAARGRSRKKAQTQDRLGSKALACPITPMHRPRLGKSLEWFRENWRIQITWSEPARP